MKPPVLLVATLAFPIALACAGCGDGGGDAAVSIQNDFNDPQTAFQPPWTICRSAYLGVDFGTIDLGTTSAAKTVKPGLDFVLMVGAWNDPGCDPAHALPIATMSEEEVVGGQTRTIAVNLANHQGACPPEGVAPLPEAQYDRIVARWPEFGFKPYAERTQNPQCAH
jgi:hypothetical protein